MFNMINRTGTEGEHQSMAPDELSKLLPTAKQIMEQVALAEAEKASEAMRQKAKADAARRRLFSGR